MSTNIYRKYTRTIHRSNAKDRPFWPLIREKSEFSYATVENLEYVCHRTFDPVEKPLAPMEWIYQELSRRVQSAEEDGYDQLVIGRDDIEEMAFEISAEANAEMRKSLGIEPEVVHDGLKHGFKDKDEVSEAMDYLDGLLDSADEPAVFIWF
jgi:hypothetical protein